MSNLEKIVGGNINRCGGIDKCYQPTGFSVGQGGSIREGYIDTGVRILNSGIVTNNYGMDTGMRVNSLGNITKY